MVFELPGATGGESVQMASTPEERTPRQIVTELDRYIIGQTAAKRAVAVALRSRMRRQKLPRELAEEIAPKNIIMIGPTGVGKTEIARRLARLAQAPFLKVEATRFTEVGYVGRDVESMVRDLMGLAMDMVQEEKFAEVLQQATSQTEDRLLNALLPTAAGGVAAASPEEGGIESHQRTREKLRQKLRAGNLEEAMIEIEVPMAAPSSVRLFTGGGMEDLEISMKEILPSLFGGARGRKQRMKVSEARPHLIRQEQERLIDHERVTREAVRRVEQGGIIFIDEIDKVAGREGGNGPDVSREGVQRDILPIVEGTTVHTRQGMVRTDHILFIASGAFHTSKPSDLIPELQGRFPIRVELDPLGKEEFVRILTEPQNALIRQYTALLGTEGVQLEFTPDAIDAIAEYAHQVNERTENIGARRLHTVLEKLLDEISFEAPDLATKKQRIDAAYVHRMLASIARDQDHSKYIL
ncbi:MAG: ATP-dependent protease ATPase subunit HslU [Acidobacteriota bacterium]